MAKKQSGRTARRAASGPQRAPAKPRPRSDRKPADPAAAAAAAHHDRSGEPPHRWTFLTNHAHVLIVLDANPNVVLREVALRVGITERAVQRIIQELEEAGYIERERVGRQNHYRVLQDKPLRHPIEAHRNIGDLLRLISERSP